MKKVICPLNASVLSIALTSNSLTTSSTSIATASTSTSGSTLISLSNLASTSGKDSSQFPINNDSIKKHQLRGLISMLERDNVTKAEIIWSLHLTQKHDSQRSGGEATSLFSLMFPDSEIASKMKLFSPYFLRALQEMCTKSKYIVIGFDESLNKVS